MKLKKSFLIFSLFLVCLISIGAISAAEDVTTDLGDTSEDGVIAAEESEDIILEETVDEILTTPQTHIISDEDSYNASIGESGLNGNPGDTYNFVSDFAGKTVYIDKDNTTITSASNVVLTDCSFRINSGISGVTINGLTIRNTISSYPIYVDSICSDINITNNNILVNHMPSYASWIYGIDFNAYDYATQTTHNFNNINIIGNTIRMYGNSYVCGIYGSDFINSTVLRNTIYAYSDTGSASKGNNAVYGIALCDDSTWATTMPKPQNNKISKNNVTVIGQSVYGIEDFGINQNVSDNRISAVANHTGSAYGIALGIIDYGVINDNVIFITTGDLTHNITTDMIHGSNAGIRLHSNSTWGYYCRNVDVKDDTIYYNTIITSPVGYTYIQNDPGNINITTTGSHQVNYTEPYPYDPVYPIIPQNRVLKSKVKEVLGASASDILMDSSVIYVDATNGNDNNNGDESSPVKTLTKALNLVSNGGTIILKAGLHQIDFNNMNQPFIFSKSVSIKGTSRENTFISYYRTWTPVLMTQPGNDGFVDFSNLTIMNVGTTQWVMDQGSSNFINVTFNQIKAFILDSKVGQNIFNFINCSFDKCGGISAEGSANAYSVNINSCIFNGMSNIIANKQKNPLSVNYCSFISCSNIVQAANKENVTFNNSYFGNNNPSSITNVDLDNWVIMTFENTTKIQNEFDDNITFVFSLAKLAHADGTFTDLQHPELLPLPSYDVTYTLTNGTKITHTLKNLKDECILPITGSGTMSAAAVGQTLNIAIVHNIILNIEKYDAIDFGGEQDLVFISNCDDITGTMTVTVTGLNYSNETTLEIYGGRAFLTLKGLNAGEYTVNVNYSGDNQYYPATNSTTFQVYPVSSDDITLKVYANDIMVGEDANIQVFVGPEGATGNVTITIDGNPTTVNLDENGIASFSIKDLSENNYTFTVKYNGDNNFENASTTAKLKVMPNTIVENLTEQLNQTKADLANKTEQLNQTKADLANKTTEIAKTQEQVTKLTQENKKLTTELNTANQKAATASNNADAKIKKIKAAKSVKKSKKYTITVTLNKKVKGKFVYVSFNGKVYKAKTNAKGIAKITIKKSALKKLAGKKVKYQVISGNSLKNKTVKIKK